MSPFTIDEDRMQGTSGAQLLVALDPHHPPTKQIPHAEFPRVVYKHPREHFRTIEHRNNRHEIVQEEIVQAEHLTMRVDNAEELERALKEGWEKHPYVPKALPDPNVALYGSDGTKAKGKSEEALPDPNVALYGSDGTKAKGKSEGKSV